jgi:hypothetical protein
MTLLVDGWLLALSNFKDHNGISFCHILFSKIRSGSSECLFVSAQNRLFELECPKSATQRQMPVLSVSAQNLCLLIQSTQTTSNGFSARLWSKNAKFGA